MGRGRVESNTLHCTYIVYYIYSRPTLYLHIYVLFEPNHVITIENVHELNDRSQPRVATYNTFVPSTCCK